MARKQPEYINIQAERALLGALLIDPSAVDGVLPLVEATDFYEPAHAAMYEGMAAVRSSGKALDLVSLTDWFASAGRLHEVGQSSVSSLMDACQNAALASEYARIVLENALQRKQLEIGNGLAIGKLDASTAKQMLDHLDQRRAGGVSRWTPKTQHLADLLHKELPPVRWAVTGLIAEGLTLLAAKAKRGKSALMLHVSMSVAAGAKAMGFFDTEQADVLYLGLEDHERRMQRRMRQMQITSVPRGLTVAYEWPPLDRGGLDALDSWLEQHPAVRLVVIDTLEHIRPTRRIANGVYGDDYASVRGLQQLAGRRQIAIVAIHHLNKRPADDPFDEINASMGLLSGVDNALVMRPSQGGIMELHRRGREYVDDSTLALKGDATTLLWTVAGKAEDVTRSAERTAIIKTLQDDAKRKAAAKKAADGMLPKEIALALGKNQTTVRRLLQKLLDETPPAIRQDANGRYHAAETLPLHASAFTPDAAAVNGQESACEAAADPERSQRSQRSQVLAETHSIRAAYVPMNSVNGVNGHHAEAYEVGQTAALPTSHAVHASVHAPEAKGTWRLRMEQLIKQGVSPDEATRIALQEKGAL